MITLEGKQQIIQRGGFDFQQTVIFTAQLQQHHIFIADFNTSIRVELE